MKRLTPYFRYLIPCRLQFGLAILFGLLYSISSGFGIPVITQYVVPFLLASGDDGPAFGVILGILLLIPAVFVVRAVSNFLNAYLMAYTGLHVLESLRVDVFRKLQTLPIAFFGGNSVGDLMSRVTNDSTVLQAGLLKIVDDLIKGPAMLLSTGAAILYLSYQQKEIGFILIVIATVPACIFPIRYVGKKVLAKARLAQTEAGSINRILNENLSAIREVRAYNLEEREIARFAVSCRAFLKQVLKTVKYDKFLTPSIEVIAAFGVSAALAVSIIKDIDPANVAALLVALYMGYEPIKKLGNLNTTLRRSEASLDRLEYILKHDDSVPDAANAIALPRPRGSVIFRDVSFAYDNTPVLNHLDIEIKPHEVVALVGPSGAGKSTFANLIPRFYDPVEGTVLIDGINIRDTSKQSLRAHIALVSQDAILFDDTIENNIRLGRPDADAAAVRAAAKAAFADEFIAELGEGYATIVGERGSRLSGGQRQRISIARAFLKDAPIIILDEPTSALDSESERKIQQALETLSKGRTVLIIAHRFSTIQHATRVLVFEAGNIVGDGTHQSLYASNNLYRGLYDLQTTTAQGEPHSRD